MRVLDFSSHGRTPGQRPGRRGRLAVCGRPKAPVPGVSVATPPGRGGDRPATRLLVTMSRRRLYKKLKRADSESALRPGPPWLIKRAAW